MTTVYLAADAPPIGTHVLVVGIGAYTHLNGGINPATNTRGLGQLTSPPISAKALIDWFLAPLHNPRPVAGFRNPVAPLASLEALIAAPQPISVSAPAGQEPAHEVTLDGATLQQVRDAFELWRTRLIAQPGNTGIFYFCGHGVSTGTQYALCQDLLRNEGVPWEMVFEVDGTLLSLGKEAPNCHVHFWIDACREVPAEILLTNQHPAPLRTSPLTNETVERSHSLLQATGAGRLAFAKENKTSRFTTALLKTLSGYAGSSKAGGPWQIDAFELANAVKELLKVENKSSERKQNSSFYDSGDGVPIIQLLGVPKVDLCLDLSPDAMREHGEIYLVPCDGASPVDVRPCIEGAYTKVVSKGVYNLGARSVTGHFQPARLTFEWVNPPFYDHIFEVAP